MNEGDGTFADITDLSGAADIRASIGLAYADYDRDGWLDLLVGNWVDGYALYKNEGNFGVDNHWLVFRLMGIGPISRDAAGARIYVTTDDGRIQLQEVKNGSSLDAGNDLALHFRLGQADLADVTIVWPNGLVQKPDISAPDQEWTFVYPLQSNTVHMPLVIANG